MVTSHDRERLAQRSAAEQALLDGFLVKPVTATMLAHAVAAAIQARCSDGTPPEPAPQRLAGLQLLVVEDNPGNQQVTRELLELEGAEVTVAGDGQQALTLLAQTRGQRGFDAVLMDVQMPVMDGTTATRLLRRQLGLTLPVIAMTAGALDTERQACLDAGMDEHIGKPFDPDTLVAVLRRPLRRRALARQGQSPRAAARPAGRRRPRRHRAGRGAGAHVGPRGTLRAHAGRAARTRPQAGAGAGRGRPEPPRAACTATADWPPCWVRASWPRSPPRANTPPSPTPTGAAASLNAARPTWRRWTAWPPT